MDMHAKDPIPIRHSTGKEARLIAGMMVYMVLLGGSCSVFESMVEIESAKMRLMRLLLVQGFLDPKEE
jgi:hypothetical protein